MIRGLTAVIIGFLLVEAIVIGGLMGAYMAMGTERAFQPGSWEPSQMWLITMFSVDLVAALVGGWVAGKIAAGPGGVRALAIVVLVLGLALAGAHMAIEQPDPGPRGAEVSNEDAMMKAEQPLWVSLLIPVVGFVGISIGGRGAKKKQR